MPKRTVNFREQLLGDLANPEEAALYLNAAAEDSEEMLLVALRDIAEAKQMAHLASRWAQQAPLQPRIQKPYIFVLITSTSSFTAAALLFSMACSSGISLIW